jgi:hypothetical protein
LFGVVICLCLRLRFCNSAPTTMLTLANVRPIYGCVGADRPEAKSFIDEVDGVLYYTCPACRLALAELDSPPLKGCSPPPATGTGRALL